MNVHTAYIDSFKNQNQKNVNIASKAQQAIITGEKQVFENFADIMVAKQCTTKYIKYSSASNILQNTRALLEKARVDLEAMKNIAFKMQETYSNALNANTNSNQLVFFDQIFQTHINALDQIASSSSYFALSLLNGDMSADHPLTFNLMDDEEIKITLPNMTNAASPIGKPGPNDPQIQLPYTIAEFDAAIDIPVGNAVNVLENIKNFCGADSFLYIVTNQINEAFTQGIADAGSELPTCITYLQGVNWRNLLPLDQALTAEALMSNVSFVNNNVASTIGLNMSFGVIEYALGNFGALNKIAFEIAHAMLDQFLPASYATKASPLLSIASPDYFPVVGVRVKEAINYILNAQLSVNFQKNSLETKKDLYDKCSVSYLENVSRLSKSNLIEESAKLSKIIEDKMFFSSFFAFEQEKAQMLDEYFRNTLKIL